jgi:hypothetical protein
MNGALAYHAGAQRHLPMARRWIAATGERRTHAVPDEFLAGVGGREFRMYA